MEPVGLAVYGADAKRRVAATGAPKGVEQAFVMPEEEKVDAAHGYRRKPDSCVFARDYGYQATYQCKEQDDQSERVDRLVTQVLRIPERQRRAHACNGRCAAQADQQEIGVHNKYQDACPSAYSSGSCGIGNIKNVGQNSDLLSEALE